MPTPSAVFAVELKDETSGAANAAASSLEKLKGKIDDDVKALSQMKRAMRNLKGATSTSSQAFAELKDKIAAQKASIASAQDGFLSLGGTFGKTIPVQATKTASAFGELTSALQGADGPLSAIGGGLAELGPLLSNPIVLAISLTKAFAAMATAIGSAAVALFKFGVAQSGARRAEALEIEGINTLRTQRGRATASVAEFQAAIDNASDSTNVGTGALQGYARQLSNAGLRGDELTEAVEAMGIAAQVQGQEGANRFRSLAVQAARTGGSVRALADDYRARLGPIARRQMLSLDNQSLRLKRSLEGIFQGLRIEVFLSAVEQIQNLFSQTTVTGRALKTIVEGLFQPLLDQFGTMGPLAKRFFQGLVIGALLLTLGFLKVKKAFNDAFGGSELLENVDATNLAVGAGVVVVGALALAVTVLALAFAAVVGFMAIFVATALAIPAALLAVGAAIVGVIAEAVAFWLTFDFAALGTSMVDGIIEGLTTGGFANAVFDLANDAADTFKDVLGISSPSRVFAGFGRDISEGVAQGIDAGAPAVEDSASSLVDVPNGGGLGGATTISIGDVNVAAGETSDPRALAIAFRDELAEVLEGVSIEMGTA